MILVLQTLAVLGLLVTAVAGSRSDGDLGRIEMHARIASMTFLMGLFAQVWIVLYLSGTAGLVATRSCESLALSHRQGVRRVLVPSLLLLMAAVVLGGLAYAGYAPRAFHVVVAWVVIPTQILALVRGGILLLRHEGLIVEGIETGTSELP